MKTEQSPSVKRFFRTHRRAFLAALLAVLHTVVVVYFHEEYIIRCDDQEFWLIMGGIWLGHIVFLPGLQLALKNWTTKETILSLQMVWAITCLMGTVYLADTLRSVLLMYCFGIMLFGAFQLQVLMMTVLAGYSVLAYCAVIYLLDTYQPYVIYVPNELQMLLGFSLAMFGCAVVGAEICHMRVKLNKKNEELNSALKTIKEISVTDELTGIYNRRFIMDEMEQWKMMADRGGYKFCISFLDLDHFKKINDTQGHAIGDKVLQIFTEIAKEQIRKTDHLARFGGEEFVLIMSLSGKEAAEMIAERIRRQTDEFNFDKVAPGLHVTVSIGVTDYHQNEDLEEALARADQALYEAKDHGRNCVITH